jgi:hypothetical protein
MAKVDNRERAPRLGIGSQLLGVGRQQTGDSAHAEPA